MAEGRRKVKGEKAEKGGSGTKKKNVMYSVLNIGSLPCLIRRQQLIHMPLTFRVISPGEDDCWLLRR